MHMILSKEKEAKRHSRVQKKQSTAKELRFSTNISDHDKLIKIKYVVVTLSRASQSDWGNDAEHVFMCT
jgi:hypothetical protein